jgi:hypothetical protein
MMARLTKCFVVCNFAAMLAWPQPQGSLPGAPGDAEIGPLKIRIIAGGDGANVLKDQTAVSPVVEVWDNWELPISGATVTFKLPDGRPGAVFANGEKSLTVTTDGRGRATAADLRPLGRGTFAIGVRASYKGATGAATVTQTNFPTLADAQKVVKLPSTAMALSGGAKVALVVGGLAAAAGIALAVVASEKKNCTSQLNTFETDNSTAAGLPTGSTQWVAATQNEFSALAQYCSCAGGLGQLSSESGTIQQLETDGSELGFAVPTSCGSL